MMKKLIPLLLMPLAVTLAQPGLGFGARHKAWDKDLDLTKEQQEKITDLRTDFQKEAIDMRADMQKLRLELQEQMRTDKPNRKAIEATVDKITAQQNAIMKARVNTHLGVREVLTPEQREKFDARPMKQGFGRERGLRPGRGFRRW
ncbi:MAG: Spy/CpxP family protein refolding chaperone [Fidelibacterota bacterium]|nr:MAG: Spy/CpxP family protein refolding chaperone [Candidatus Neomarinimicrobiota bacterium]